MSKQAPIGVESLPFDHTLVITNYNHAHYIIECLESAIAQTYKRNKIVVVDDRSTDNSVAVIKDFITKHPDKNIRLIEHETNQGVSVARNTGIQAGDSPFYSFLDSDDKYFPDKVAVSIGKLCEYPQLGLAYTDYQQFNETTGVTHSEVKAPFDSKMLWQYCMASTNATFRKGVFEKVGLFNPTMRLMEDYELYIRASLHFCFVHIPVPLWQRRDHDGCITLKTPRPEWMETEKSMKQRLLAEINGVKS